MPLFSCVCVYVFSVNGKLEETVTIFLEKYCGMLLFSIPGHVISNLIPHLDL